MITPSRPRVLLIAEAANPEWVSVPLVGWSIARALRQVADVHVVTQVRNRPALERAGWEAGRDFTALESEAVAAPLWRLVDRLRAGSGVSWTLVAAMSVPAYYWFERLLWRQFEDKLRAGAFDLVHRVTPLSPATPSLLARRLRAVGVPFVVGPLNGGVPWPRELLKVRRQEREWLSRVRGAHRLLPGYRAMREGAAAILVGSRITWQELDERWRAKAVYLPENGSEAVPDAPPEPRPAGQPLRVVFVGRLVPLKGVDMLLDSCAELVRAGRATLELVGDGPERPALERKAAELGLGGGLVFRGWVAHAEVGERLRQAHVLAFPSIREFGGGVVIEAMAAGTVPVVVDYAGPAELVTPETGCLVPLGPRATIVAGLRDRIARLADDEVGRSAMAVRAQERIRRWLTWERKAEQIAAVYAWVLGRADKPDFGMPFP
jgi:glycosyltransferase involved in cell wall biosynthesis